MLPSDPAAAATVQAQLLDFIRRSVADAFSRAQVNLQALTPAQALSIVTQVYEQAFSIVQTMGEAAAEE